MIQFLKLKNSLKENNLFADEPTINAGETHTQFSIQVDTNKHKLPLAQIRFELALRNAVNIDTIPIDSSIPSINVLGFLAEGWSTCQIDWQSKFTN